MYLNRFDSFFPIEGEALRKKVAQARAVKPQPTPDSLMPCRNIEIRLPSDFPRANLSSITALRMTSTGGAIHFHLEDIMELTQLKSTYRLL